MNRDQYFSGRRNGLLGLKWPSGFHFLRHHLDLAHIIYFDVWPLLLADHDPMNSNGLAFEVCSEIVNAASANFARPLSVTTIPKFFGSR